MGNRGRDSRRQVTRVGALSGEATGQGGGRGDRRQRCWALGPAPSSASTVRELSFCKAKRGWWT